MTAAPSPVDVLVIGAGIAGASVGYALARAGRRVRLLEREEHPGYHSTGRSAALFSETYGPLPVRRLSTASRPFLEAPPPGFADTPLLGPRGLMFLGEPGHEDAVEAFAAEARAGGAVVEVLDDAGLRDRVPILRPGVFSRAALEPEAMDLDVHSLHHGFLRGLKAAGGLVSTRAEAAAITRSGDLWHVETRAGARFAAPILVNAAGAWADEIAVLAGAAPLGLVPKRRTGIMLDPPLGLDVRRWPLTGDLTDQFYIKPEGGRLMLSPADATPVPPQDVQPEVLDIARAMDRFLSVTTLRVDTHGETWAGLRNFVADHDPVAGFAAEAPGFFWLAGQGGYGIQTAAALGRLAAALIQDQGVPPDIADLGLTADDLAPGRTGLRDGPAWAARLQDEARARAEAEAL
ncbi:NAD(P)/FAD-dependent oxidoreductase [Roseospira goensis]|uniref:D-arginine dehydrogenase n=1 Tax=Roseospira goensis TaxID=391922 RepID=A0A7W6RYH3_9PROT|nr:FAD-dependent oxidoreductase [Roseospira goensis]MBB4285575.1 D-arginine dehydrogenase [Roseospira goensis]